MAETQTAQPSAAPELKKTLTLPETAFPMKANLPQNEPARLQKWAEMELYEQIRAARRGAKKYVLHDGPPYANGPIHLGHALNKCLKDFVVKSKTMAGYDSPYVPGWDCHGLPIEIKVDEQLERRKLQMPAEEFLSACRAYAQKYVDLQRTQFERLGVFGQWDRPYLTMSPAYEAATLETFYRFFERGFVYKGLKPVYWCLHDRTALADAEIEYEMHTSPSVYVRYRLLSPLAGLEAFPDAWAIIWTTTPWTLPASVAIAFHPEFDYVALRAASGEVYLVAAPLAESVREACALGEVVEVARFRGAALERARFQHPFLDREVLGVLADYVTTDQGTGAVHTAPAHGADDFYTGVRYGLSAECNVDAAGRLRNGVALWEGKTVFEANPFIVEHLRERGALLGGADTYHSYPHCWRCHRPVIFRATEQWFIGMETAMPYGPNRSSSVEQFDDDRTNGDRTFRERALEQIRTAVQWDPKWGEERIANMVATRPDWCISRQRVWGVPIAVFLCGACHEPLRDRAVNARVVQLVREGGAGAWHAHSTEEILGPDRVCARCGAQGRWEKEQDILDVWFDSGSSWRAVLASDEQLGVPADLYFEGGDQYRGWFHTSLLTAVGTRDDEGSPYRKVATSGWTLDEQGRAMSKSLGNGVDPVDVSNRMGAEIVRLWVASVDFREDVAASENLMGRVAENYRKLRNTFRFLLGNLAGFVPAAHAVGDKDLLPLDRYMLARTRELVERVTGWYEAMEFHRVYHAVNEFCIVDLSALYLDVLKDRMYTLAPSSLERRSAQTALWRIAEALVRLVAPVLSFTAEEIWGYLPEIAGREASVHLARFPETGAFPEESAGEAWTAVFALREEVLRSLEEARKAKRIGKALEAQVRITAPAAMLRSVDGRGAALKELFNVSQVALEAGDSLAVETLAAEGAKCGRCWNYRTDVAPYGPWPEVCGRCAGALDAMGYSRATGGLVGTP